MAGPACTGVPARVISLEPSNVQLAVQSAGACAQCAKGRGCGLGLQRSGKHVVTLALSEIRLVGLSGQITCTSSAQRLLLPGCQVHLQLPEPQLMTFILKALFFPAALVILMAALGHHMGSVVGFSADGGAVAGMVVAGLGGLILARNSINRTQRKSPHLYQAQLTIPSFGDDEVPSGVVENGRD